ncbi:Protein ERGIC-53, partial [Nibea albiflora]
AVSPILPQVPRRPKSLLTAGLSTNTASKDRTCLKRTAVSRFGSTLEVSLCPAVNIAEPLSICRSDFNAPVFVHVRRAEVVHACSGLCFRSQLTAACSVHSKLRREIHTFKHRGFVCVRGRVTFKRGVKTADAIPSADQVRITPSLRSQRGTVWTKNRVNFENWEAEVTFRVSGRGRMGADGLAVWFTAAQGLDGPVYGAADQWNGVGVFFDSFDNDGKKNNPAIIVVGNNGNLVYDHQNDGTTQALGTCLRDFRNKPYPVRAKITYYKKTLTVMINNGFTPDKEDYEFCTRVDNMVIPTEGFFGISAATGGLAVDDLYESVNDREIRQVFEGQNRIHLEIKQLHRQLAMILDEQRRYVSVITDEVTKKGTNAESGQLDTQHLGSVVATQQEVLKNLHELRNSFHESLKQIGSVQHQGNAGGMGTYETIQHFNDIKEHLHTVKRDVEHLVQRNVPNPAEKIVKCPELPPMPSCLSTVHFVIFIVVQSVLFFCYIMYK